ncbi:MAG: integrase family protein [Alphaproteobacteria bacterium]|nr:integrase family protein [Alphaproteobacteria bacterium]
MLTVVQIKALKPRDKAYKVADGKGLYLSVQPSGSLVWRVKFRFHGVAKKITLGHYPDVGLKEAREKLEEARELLAALKRLERKGHHETAHRLRAFSGRIFRYAVSTLRAQHNPADILRGALIAPKVKHHPDAIDRAFAHSDRDHVRAAYHRGAHWAERVKMAQWWSDHLAQLRDGAEIIHPQFGRT